MKVDTYDATPMHEEVLHVSKGRVFNSGINDPSPLWFELAPDRFWVGSDYADAVHTRDRVPRSRITVERLREAYPKGKLTTE